MNIAIIGSGYVGLVAAAAFAEIGHNVTCVDNDASKVEALNRGETLIHERFLPELLARHRGERLVFTQNIQEAIRSSSVIFIAVGTPSSENGEADLSLVENVACAIARNINSHKIIVEKSTVPVCTSQWICRVMMQNGAPGDMFDVVCNPEFLREGTAVTDFLYPHRIVIGADSTQAADTLRKIYMPLADGSYAKLSKAIPQPDNAIVPTRLIVTSAESAEVIKHASNAFLAMKISFINAVANVCENVGADVEEVCRGIGSDARIGTEFLKPGIGYGGSCFPKDLTAFRSVSCDSGYDFRLLDEVRRINEDQRHRFLRKVRQALWNLRGKRLAVLGLSYKGGTDDIRESPAIAMIHLLLKEGCDIVAYDPAAMERAKEEFPNGEVEFSAYLYDTAVNADAVLILTDWEEFASLDLPRLRKAMKNPIIVDGRNLYRPETMNNSGFTYYSIGRRQRVARRLVQRSNTAA
ncbi:MAG: UDP-glucose dehydrogenase [Acidobacteriales bacterium]|nr:UDP-glucose dehydrogenase [Terriglobales bacterium]